MLGKLTHRGGKAHLLLRKSYNPEARRSDFFSFCPWRCFAQLLLNANKGPIFMKNMLIY